MARNLVFVVEKEQKSNVKSFLTNSEFILKEKA